MPSAFDILNVSPTDDDAIIRKRYLELVRKYTPEQHPERFSQIRQAYEKIQTLSQRVDYLLESEYLDISLEEILNELALRVHHAQGRFPDYLRLYEQQDEQ
jgi:curved DNA-binding protein CbpA